MSRVLVVEDDPGVARMVEMMLALEGHDAELVTDGRTAVQRLDGSPPALVILDVMIPEVDGLQVLRELRSRPRWAEVPVVVCSALASDEDVWEGWSSGADYYLVKPFELDHLRSTVLRLLSIAASR